MYDSSARASTESSSLVLRVQREAAVSLRVYYTAELGRSFTSELYIARLRRQAAATLPAPFIGKDVLRQRYPLAVEEMHSGILRPSLFPKLGIFISLEKK